MDELIADQHIQVLIPPDSGGRTTRRPAGLTGAAQRYAAIRGALASPTGQGDPLKWACVRPPRLALGLEPGGRRDVTRAELRPRRAPSPGTGRRSVELLVPGLRRLDRTPRRPGDGSSAPNQTMPCSWRRAGGLMPWSQPSPAFVARRAPRRGPGRPDLGGRPLSRADGGRPAGVGRRARRSRGPLGGVSATDAPACIDTSSLVG